MFPFQKGPDIMSLRLKFIEIAIMHKKVNLRKTQIFLAESAQKLKLVFI